MHLPMSARAASFADIGPCHLTKLGLKSSFVPLICIKVLCTCDRNSGAHTQEMLRDGSLSPDELAAMNSYAFYQKQQEVRSRGLGVAG